MTWFGENGGTPQLPEGAATEQRQEEANTLLQQIVGTPPGAALTDAELRASPVDVGVRIWDLTTLPGGRIPVSLPPGGSGLTDSELRASPIDVNGPLTDAELRAAPVPVDTGLNQGTTPADTQPVSAASLPLPAGAATQATLASVLTELQSILTKLNASVAVTGTFYQATQPISAVSLPLMTGAATAALQGGGLPSVLASDRLKVDGSGVTQPVSGTITVNQRTHQNWQTVVMHTEERAPSGTSEVLISMDVNTDSGAAASGTSYNVPTGKVFVIHSITASISSTTGNTTAVKTIVRLRVNTAGAALVTSELQLPFVLAGIAAANNANLPSNIVLPMGMRFAAGSGIGITVQVPNYVATTAAPRVTITVFGHLYDA